MYSKQITVNYSERVNPYTCRLDKSFSFLQSEKFKVIKLQDVKKMEFGDIIDYMLDIYDYVNFLKYIGKYKKAKIIEKIEAKVIDIAKEKRAIMDEVNLRK